MNVMKQDAMDDKTTKRCKTCEKQCMQEDLDRSRNCRAAIEQKPTLMDWTVIEQTESFSMDREAVELDKKKKVFRREEKYTKKDCNQASYSTKDPNNILSFQKQLSTRKMSSI